MLNPFRQINKADELEIKTINLIFTKNNKIWNSILEPVNHIIIGSMGSGKSILLRRLSASSIKEEDFLKTNNFFGIYFHLSRITKDFNTIFNTIERSIKDGQNLWNRKLLIVRQIYSNYVCLYLLKNFCEEIKNSSSKSFYPWSVPETRQKIADEISDILDLKGKKNIEEIIMEIDKQIFKVDNTYLAGEWLVNNELKENWLYRLNIHTIPETLSQIIYKYTPEKGRYVYFLLDTSEYIHPECQKLHNSFFERGFSFTTKLAKRPYHLSTLETLSGRYLKPDTEFSILFLDYLLNDKEEYEKILVTILKQCLNYIKGSHPEFSNISTEPNKFLELNNGKSKEYYSIFTTVSIRNFINFLANSWDNLCEEKDNISMLPEIKISKESLEDALKKFAKLQFETILQVEPLDKSIASSERYLAKKEITIIYEFLKSKLNRLAKEKKKMELLIIKNEDLFISEDIQTQFFKPAFADGIFRFCTEEKSYLLDVPNECYLSPIYLIAPPLELYEYHKGTHTETINEKEIRNFMKNFFKKKEVKEVKDEYNAFLACSFKEAPLPNENRDSIKEVAKLVKINVYDAQDLGITEQTKGIRDKIKEFDFVIVELSRPTPNIMFELGMVASFEKFFIPLVNEETDKDMKEKLKELLMPYTYYEYNLQGEKLKETFERIREVIKSRIVEKEKLYEPSFRATDLRPLKPRGKKNMIYISYPEEFQPTLWEKVLEEISKKLKQKGCPIISNKNSGLASFEATKFQIPIYCSSESKFCVIDTSQTDEPDLFQSYVLGICFGLNRNTIRIEQNDRANETGLSLWNSYPYKKWSDIEELKNIILEFINPD